MAIIGDLVLLGLAFLLAPAIAEYANIRKKAERGFNWIAAAGVLFLFAGTLGSGLIPASLADTLGELYIRELFYVVGWIFSLIGAVLGAYEILAKK
ncbi:MAG: hypothetical protein QXP77_00485 [Candidatus Aenigmatarchaeota archaeon]